MRTANGEELFVKLVGREHRDADWLFRAWRFLAFRELEDEAPFITAKQQVEHEAYLSLLAERAGVRTPAVELAVPTTDRKMVFAERAIRGRSLDRPDGPSSVSEMELQKVWCEVAKLRRAHIAHRDLRLANIVMDEAGDPWIVDFGFGEAAASPRRLSQDVAELLVSLGCLVGAKRAAASAAVVLGPDALEAALPLLQPLALTAATRRALRGRPDLLRELREEIGQTTGRPVPEPARLVRVRPSTLLLLAGGAFALHLLLPQVGELRLTREALQSARPAWLAAATLASALTYLAAALAQMAAVSRPLALGRTLAVQLASGLLNRTAPGGLGAVAANQQYLERAGLDRAEAMTAVALKAAAGAAVHVTALVACTVLFLRQPERQARLPVRWSVLPVVVVALVAAGLVLRTPLGRGRLVDPLRRAIEATKSLLRTPGKLVTLLAGAAGITASYVAALACSLASVGAHASIVTVSVVYLGATAIASASPTPSGLGAVEAGLVAGLVEAGTRTGPAIAGVLLFRLLTYWLPMLPGALAFRFLRHRGVL